MRLESALFSSRAGLTAQGQGLAVVGDNISNANTTAYKHSRVEFADLVNGGAEGAGTLESVRGAGSGVQTQVVRTLHSAGTLEPTGRQLDIGIAGEGFFILQNETGTQELFTRAGAFNLDQTGYLVSADGYRVMGYAPGDTQTLTGLDLLNVGSEGAATGAAAISGNLDSREAAAAAAPANPVSFADLASMSSYTAPFRVYDSLGAEHDVRVDFTKLGANQWVAQAFIDGGDVGGTAGVPVQIGANVALNFETDGTLTAENAAAAVITAAPAYSNGAAAGNFTIDLGRFSQRATESSISGVTADGEAPGNVLSYEITANGQIMAQLDSGSLVDIGTVAMTRFGNPDGLERAGDTTFVATDQAGRLDDGAPADGGRGKTQQGSLERSTVDIADQFVDLVLFQRAYQASSQTLNAASGMIRDTLSLIR